MYNMVATITKLALIILVFAANLRVEAAVPRSRDAGFMEMGKGFPSLGNGLGSGVLGSSGQRAESAVRQTWTYAICQSGGKLTSNNQTGNKNMTEECAQCFLSVPQDQMFSDKGGKVALNCSRRYLAPEYEICSAMFMNNTETDKIMGCFQNTFRRTEVGRCIKNATNSTDEVDKYMQASSCVKQKIKDFKKYVRLAMVDKVLGNSGCSFAAIVALKMFGKGMSAKSDRLDALIDEMVEEDDMNEFDTPKTRPNYSTKPFLGKEKNPGRGGRGNRRPNGKNGKRKGNSRSKRQTGGFEEDEYEDESGYESDMSGDNMSEEEMSDGFDEELDDEEF